MTPEPQHAGRGLRDQIERYRTAFVAIVAMIAVALFTGGYVLTNERLALPSWFPVLGQSNFHIAAEFESAQAVTPGQGQAVTIAGAKIGEVSNVELKNGVSWVDMEVDPKYARYIHPDATFLLRPKTQLKDETIDIAPGTKSAGHIHEGELFPLAQTAPDVNFYEFLGALDAETRTYLQELLAAAGGALEKNGRALSADFRRFDPITRELNRIAGALQSRHLYIQRGIHNFQLLLSTLGSKDRQVAEGIAASNKVFAVFAKEDEAVKQTLKLLPGALASTKSGLGKLTRAADVTGPTLKALHPFAASLAEAQRQSRTLFENSTPIIEKQLIPFVHEVLPVLREMAPATKGFAKALPPLTSGFAVLNELFNELAHNPGPKQAGFLFFADWAAHNFNSALSNADANGPMGRTLLYFNCELTPIIEGVAEVNPNVKLLDGLLNPPTAKECEEHHLKTLAGAGG